MNKFCRIRICVSKYDVTFAMCSSHWWYHYYVSIENSCSLDNSRYLDKQMST